METLSRTERSRLTPGLDQSGSRRPYLLEHWLERRLAKIVTWTLTDAFVFVVCLSRVVVDVHSLLDTIGGLLLEIGRAHV